MGIEGQAKRHQRRGKKGYRQPPSCATFYRITFISQCIKKNKKIERLLQIKQNSRGKINCALSCQAGFVQIKYKNKLSK